MAAFDFWVLPNRVPADACMAHFCRFIDASEKERAARFKFAKHRNDFIYRRIALRMVLAKYVEALPQDISFMVNPFGKPYLALSDVLPTIHFNLSVTQSTVVIVVCPDEQIGVDIEDCKNDLDVSALGHLVLTSSEMASFANVPAGEQVYEFFRYWVAKEAVLKANGTGLSISPNTLEVDLEEGQTVLSDDFRRDYEMKDHCFCFQTIGPNRICAIAARSIPMKCASHLYEHLPLQEFLKALENSIKPF